MLSPLIPTEPKDTDEYVVRGLKYLCIFTVGIIIGVVTQHYREIEYAQKLAAYKAKTTKYHCLFFANGQNHEIEDCTIIEVKVPEEEPIEGSED